MSTKKNIPNYTRLPAKTIVGEKRLEVVTKLNMDLMQLIGQHFPAMQQDLTKITQGYQQNMAALNALEGELVLRGHGARGVLLSQSLLTENDNNAFIATLVSPAEQPLSPDALIASLQNYLTIDIMGQNGMTKSWVMPEESMYGQLVFDGNKQPNADLLELPEGIYLVREEQRAFYTLKIELADAVLLFSPNTGPSLVTYSDVEQGWVQHTAWQYVDGPKALAAIDAFFAKTNVRDVTPNEFRKLNAELRKAPNEVLMGAPLIVSGDRDSELTVKISDLYAIRLGTDGQGSIVSFRDDLPWTDLSLFTRRQMYREVTTHVLQAITPPASAEEVVEDTPVVTETPIVDTPAAEITAPVMEDPATADTNVA